MSRPNTALEAASSSHPEWTEPPTQIKHIEQVAHHGKVTSFEAKDDLVHAHILALVWDDRVADMSASCRRGLANNIHFLLMKHLYYAITTRKVVAEDIGLLNQFDPLNGRHRVQIVVRGTEPLSGGWVQHAGQALDSLRRVVDGIIHHT